MTITNGTPRAVTTAAGTDFLLGVACSSATSCLAVGTKGPFFASVGAVVPVTYAPGVSGYRLTRNPFVVGGGSPPKAASAAKTKKHKKGTTFHYTLSEAAAVKMRLSRSPWNLAVAVR